MESLPAAPASQVEPPLLNRSQVAERLRISVRQLDRLVSSTNFPTPLKIGLRSPRWREADINNYIAGLVK